MGGRRAGCWRRRGSAPRAGDDGPPRSSVRPTRHSPPHGDIADADVAAAAAGRAARFSYGVIAKHAALNDQQFSGGRLTRLALNPRAREGRADPSPSVAERPAIRPTRWRRLLAAVADSFFAKFRFGRTLMMLLLLLLLLLRLAAAQRRGQR